MVIRLRGMAIWLEVAASSMPERISQMPEHHAYGEGFQRRE